MNKKEIEELMEYNLEYLEARNSEEIFGGDYTSEIDLKYANKEIEKLQQENKQLKKCLEINHKIIDIYVERIDKAIKYIEEKSKSNIRNIVIITLAEIEELLKILKGEE